MPSCIHAHHHLVRTKLTWRRGRSATVRPSMLTRCWKMSSRYWRISFPLASTLKGANFKEHSNRQVNFDRTWTSRTLQSNASKRSSWGFADMGRSRRLYLSLEVLIDYISKRSLLWVGARTQFVEASGCTITPPYPHNNPTPTPHWPYINPTLTHHNNQFYLGKNSVFRSG